MIGRYGALPGGWLNPVNVGSDIAASVTAWWSPPATPVPQVGVSDQDFSTPTQIILSPDVSVPQRVERPVNPVQSPVPGVSAQDMARDPYQTQVQLPPRAPGSWTPWAIGAAIFAALVSGAAGFVAVRRRRRVRR
jgi:hypothetical protein